MIPRQFEYHAPQSVAEAVALLKEYGDSAKLLAGGHSLLPMMKMRFAEPEHLVDLGRIAGLRGIREEGNELRIGAMTTENDLIWSSLVQEKCPLLVEGAREHPERSILAQVSIRERNLDEAGVEIQSEDPRRAIRVLLL